MIDERGHGVKRKLSDVDDGLQTRCYQRQTIFNISMCKLRKNYCGGEPMLSKTVLIANTIRMIELDMAEEREQTTQYNTTTSSSCSPEDNFGARMEDDCNVGAHKTRESIAKPLDLMNFEEELNLLGDKIVRELGLDLSKNYERKTTVTCVDVTDTNNNASSERTADGERDATTVSCSSLLGLELTDELEFGDIDLSLYDFDSCGATALPLDVEELCAAWGLTNALRCSNSVKKERSVSENFDELDQVMQILVSS